MSAGASASASAVIKGLSGKNPDLRDLLIALLVICGSLGAIIVLLYLIAYLVK